MNEMMKNRMKICGTKTSTPPTPANIPSKIRALIKSWAPMLSSSQVVPLRSGPLMKASSRSDSGLPIHSKVSLNVRYMNSRKVGIPRNLSVTIRSILSEKVR
ncbi:hypothetical protein D3C72_1084000 [compost metagenome]